MDSLESFKQYIACRIELAIRAFGNELHVVAAAMFLKTKLTSDAISRQICCSRTFTQMVPSS